MCKVVVQSLKGKVLLLEIAEGQQDGVMSKVGTVDSSVSHECERSRESGGKGKGK